MQTQPIDFHPPAEEAASFLLPVKASLFADRADRFAALAAGHSLGDWLVFLGQLTRAQHDALKALPKLPLPDAATLDQARNHGMPPLNASSLVHPAIWRDVLRQMATTLGPYAPDAARDTLAALAAADDEQLEKLAATLLAGAPEADESAALPFVGAALQVVFSAQASQLGASQLQTLDAHGVCPCCGSLPVASIVRLGAAINNLRYLHCSLCNTEWNVPRAVCTACETDKGVALHEVEGSNGAVRAETCDSCKSYLKIVYQEKDPNVDPVADDLATLALDLLAAEAGYERAGPNLLLIGAHSG
jgi:FdhE protein